ncbi:hypothetical protein ACHWQZ_G016145 [Mnemiopsis leidyi]
MRDVPSSSNTSSSSKVTSSTKVTSSFRSQLREEGRQLREYLELQRDDNKYPIMLPLIPKSKFPDKFPDETVTQSELKEINQQKEYEAEVEVFHALEKMVDSDTIIFHGFNYTAEQYGLFVLDEQGNPIKQQGETDFIIVHRLLGVSILEVKAPDFKEVTKHEQTFRRNFEDSEKQGCKMMKLIEERQNFIQHHSWTILSNPSSLC